MAEEKKKQSNRVIYICGFLQKVDEETTKDIITKLFQLEQESKKRSIRVIVNTYGGSVNAMMAIYDAMATCEAPIAMVGIGKIMSAGVLLLAAGKKGERHISINARIMVHEMWGVTWGTLYQVRSDVEEWERQEKLFCACLSKETGKSAKEIKKVMDAHKEVYITPQEAQRFGIVDKIMG